MAVWDELLTKQDKEVFAKAGYGKKMTLGKNIALLVIDMTYEFIGFQPEPILKAVETFHTSCGEIGWQALEKIKPLMQSCRQQNLPVLYTVGHKRENIAMTDPWAAKKVIRSTSLLPEMILRGKEVADEIKPEATDIVIAKQSPSAFFGTPLIYYLQCLRTDTLFVVGCTTSGCVRGTVADAFSYGFKVAVIEDCVFDRGETTHKMNLFDMQAKYCNVMKSHEAIEYLQSITPHQTISGDDSNVSNP